MIFSEQFIQEYENNNSLGKLNDLVSQSLFNDDFQTAANLLQQVLTLDGNDPVSWMNLGHCLLQLGNYQECLTAYQYACLLWKEGAPAQLWFGLGMLCLKCRQYDQAENYLIATLKLDPEFELSLNVYIKLGSVNKKLKKYYQAIVYWRHCLSSPCLGKDQAIQVLCNIANCLEFSNVNRAIELYLRACQIKSTFLTLTCLGWAYFLNREFDKSLILYRKATEIAKNPDSKSHCDILYLKSRCLIEMKSIDRASTFLNRILEKFPKEPIYKMTNAIVLVEMGQWKSALDSIEDCLNLECDLSEIYCGLGIINERMFQKDEAEEAYKKAVKIDANNTLASRRMALLRKHKNKPRNIPNLIHLSFDITEIPFLTYQKWNA